MGTKYPEIWNALAADFDKRLVRERKAGGGRMVPYITARTAMNRLDSVLGFENWWDDYERDGAAGSDNIICRITIRLSDGSTVTKADAGSPGSTGDEGEDDKGAFSDAFKRAAVKFGIGRTLYGDGVFLCREKPRARVTGPEEPAGPEAMGETRAMAAPPAEPAAESDPRPAPAPAPANGHGSPPRSGRQLFAWVKDQEKRHDVGLVKYLNGWAKLQDFPGRMIDWSPDQATAGHAEAARKLRALAPDPALPFQTPAGFREWAEARMADDQAHAIGTEMRFPGSWLSWSIVQCSEVYHAILEHVAEDAAELAGRR